MSYQTFVNVRRASAIFGVAEINFEKEEKNGKTVLKISGDEFHYFVTLKKDMIKVSARDKETNRSNTLFEAPKNYKDINGDEFRISNPYIMFEVNEGEYYIFIKKQKKEYDEENNKYYFKTAHIYRFAVK